MARRSAPLDISLTRSPGRLLFRAHSLLRAGLVRTLQEAGYALSAEQWCILLLLWQHDDLPQLEIGERVDKDRHHVSRLVDGLVDLGLVKRLPTGSDRRIRRVALTDAGHKAKPKLSRAVTAYLQHALDGIAPADYERFLACLDHIITRLKDSHEPC